MASQININCLFKSLFRKHFHIIMSLRKYICAHADKIRCIISTILVFCMANKSTSTAVPSSTDTSELTIYFTAQFMQTLQWHHNKHDGISNHQPLDCFLNSLFRHRSKKTSKLHITGLCVGNSPVTGEFPEQRASNAENVSIWQCHHKQNLWEIPCPQQWHEHINSFVPKRSYSMVIRIVYDQ